MSSHDAGMHAVARVRGVREQDSRLGLRQAATEQADCESRLADLRSQRDRLGTLESGTAGDFVARHDLVGHATDSIRAAVARVEEAAGVTAAARAHWQLARTRLSAVEMLLERRAEDRRAERGRRDARDLDETATQLWLRHRATGGAA